MLVRMATSNYVIVNVRSKVTIVYPKTRKLALSIISLFHKSATASGKHLKSCKLQVTGCRLGATIGLKPGTLNLKLFQNRQQITLPRSKHRLMKHSEYISMFHSFCQDSFTQKVRCT